jgi:hypothetical protein
LQSHQDREQSTATPIPFAKWMYQDEFGVYHGQGGRQLVLALKPAGCVLTQRPASEFMHQLSPPIVM